LLTRLGGLRPGSAGQHNGEKSQKRQRREPGVLIKPHFILPWECAGIPGITAQSIE
jgi:hypothetical protein